MKTRTLATVSLALTLAVPAFSQQAAQPDTATGKQPLKHEQRDFWDGDEPGLASLVFHPFASKKYVQRNTQVIRDRVNELDELTAANSNKIKDVDARAQQGIQLASTKTNLADEHAMDATNKAQLAHQTATSVNTHLASVETVVGNIDQYKPVTQAEIRFRPGQTDLSKPAKDALDQLAGQLKNQRGYLIEVQGYSAGRGQTAIVNSKKVANAVVRYLRLTHDIPSYRIYVIGMGDAPTDNKVKSGTRVEVSLLQNDLAQTASKQ